MAKAPILEATPEFDEIDGLPLPREQTRLYGHEIAETELLDAYRSQRFHHAWILGGPKGIGKATLAFRFARFILEHPDRFSTHAMAANSLYVPPESHNAQMVAAGSHADILHLRRPWDLKTKRFKRDLPVDEVRKTTGFFGATAAGGNWRICIVDSADDMNQSAANALLKILEEPPKQSLFILLSHNPGRLLPTVRSRCRKLTMRKLDEPIIEQALTESHVGPPRNLQALHTLADGSLRQAALAINGGALEIAQEFTRLVETAANVDMIRVHSFADKVAGRGAEDAWNTFLELARTFLSNQLRKDASTRPDALVRWADLWEKVGRAAATADALNLDRKQVVLSFLIDLRKAHAS
ncbi:DNA polymerase III subunit tau [Pseudovibrio axinellae]|uniref:DNA polymerase III subunit tau n=1 Tax=Pseudovibrio axinellae TaxID=989403 RepID=A0A165XHP9_9HYPH|nr:DNA polymerase III subunit delta' [Pseudovibrio axinellae]KZL17711.1 DNA polymerase III subunit tau [Pseudovibrio axinellae]SER42675.1 DNA polymerase III, delta prime subunit [Pseudovibrio axinellae]